jgi:hypothetical protein
MYFILCVSLLIWEIIKMCHKHIFIKAHEHKHQPLILRPASLVGRGLTSERERMAAQVFQPGYRYDDLR